MTATLDLGLIAMQLALPDTANMLLYEPAVLEVTHNQALQNHVLPAERVV